MEKNCRVSYGFNFSNGDEIGSDEREVLSIEVRGFNMPNEKITEAKEMVEKFIENEVLKKMGW